MPTETIFRIQLLAGYAAWLLCFGAWILPWLRTLGNVNAQRAIATLHSFRFFGLVFILPGVVGPALPAGFSTFSAYGDLATGILAMLALATVRVRPLFWFFVAGYNLVGVTDLIVDYVHAMQYGLPLEAGQLAAAYVIPVIYVPLLMITHVVSLYWLMRPRLLDAQTASAV